MIVFHTMLEWEFFTPLPLHVVASSASGPLRDGPPVQRTTLIQQCALSYWVHAHVALVSLFIEMYFPAWSNRPFSPTPRPPPSCGGVIESFCENCVLWPAGMSDHPAAAAMAAETGVIRLHGASKEQRVCDSAFGCTRMMTYVFCLFVCEAVYS